jgi:hypothetical protein
VSGKKTDTDSPEQQWSKLEIEIMRDSADWADELKKPTGLANTFERVSAEIVTRLELIFPRESGQPVKP